MASQVGGRYQLEIPLDASGIEDFKPDQAVKVLAQGAKGPLASTLVKLDEKGHGAAMLAFAEPPGGFRVIVGPHDATDEELAGLQTIAVDVAARQWTDNVLKLPPIRITPYYWHWWFVWCRKFTIRGKVVCANGEPVPGAKVCGYDVDWWLWFASKQLIECTTTDATGSFEMSFKWCCGWWPWWWWRLRHWQLEPLLVERIRPVLQRGLPNLRLRPRGQPTLSDLSALMGGGAQLSNAKTIEPSVLTGLRDKLLQRLPPAPELAQLRIWPWWPWQPWLDCAPDVIFQVTQDCAGVTNGNPIIVNETIWNARHDIPTTLNVTLLAGDNACCAPSTTPCVEGNCMAPTMVCDGVIANIGGNLACPVADPALIGFQNPAAADSYSDRPFAGGVTVSATTDCMDGIDYYEFQVAPIDPVTHGPGTWGDMPPLANGAFTRTNLRFLSVSPWVEFHYPSFAATLIDGHNVYETRQHYDATHPPADWIWIGASRDWLINWLTENNFGDGTYYLRAKGWNFDSGTNKLVNGRVLKLCGSQKENYVVVTVDNRHVTPGADDAHGNPCTSVHACTDEPDTAIVDIRIVHGTTVTKVGGCDKADVAHGDKLEIDFVAYDHDGHLGEITLELHYDVNLAPSVFTMSGFSLAAGAAWDGVPAADVAKTNYHDAVAAGATRPIWKGGVFTVSVDATGPNGAFPKTCCYLLRLVSYKRTIVNCSYAHDGHANASETSFTIVI
jgi:hypothetical protein